MEISKILTEIKRASIFSIKLDEIKIKNIAWTWIKSKINLMDYKIKGLDHRNCTNIEYYSFQLVIEMEKKYSQLRIC